MNFLRLWSIFSLHENLTVSHPKYLNDTSPIYDNVVVSHHLLLSVMYKMV